MLNERSRGESMKRMCMADGVTQFLMKCLKNAGVNGRLERESKNRSHSFSSSLAEGAKEGAKAVV